LQAFPNIHSKCREPLSADPFRGQPTGRVSIWKLLGLCEIASHKIIYTRFQSCGLYPTNY